MTTKLIPSYEVTDCHSCRWADSSDCCEYGYSPRCELQEDREVPYGGDRIPGWCPLDDAPTQRNPSDNP